jgi:hypothetical protein
MIDLPPELTPENAKRTFRLYCFYSTDAEVSCISRALKNNGLNRNDIVY